MMVNFGLKITVFNEIESVIRFKHRLVKIHCFPNGNGRHSRLIADIIVENVLKKKPLTWSENVYESSIELRKNYIESLQLADQGKIQNLIEFATCEPKNRYRK